MNGYNKGEALSYIFSRLEKKDLSPISDSIQSFLSEIIDRDIEYMYETGVLDADGNEGINYYDDDDAL